jgi:hypothetical protein
MFCALALYSVPRKSWEFLTNSRWIGKRNGKGGPRRKLPECAVWTKKLLNWHVFAVAGMRLPQLWVEKDGWKFTGYEIGD